MKEEVFLFNESGREEMFIDAVDIEKEQTERTRTKKLTLNPIKKKNMTLTDEKFKTLKDAFFKATLNKSLSGRERLWALKKLKLLVDRRQRMKMFNNGEVFDEEEDGLDVTECEDMIMRQCKQKEEQEKKEQEKKEQENEDEQLPEVEPQEEEIKIH